MPKISILPSKKSVVLKKNTEALADSPLWGPPSFKTKSQESNPGHSRFLKSNKPAFIPKIPTYLESSKDASETSESENPNFDPIPHHASKQNPDFKSWAPFIFLIGFVIVIVSSISFWLAYHQGYWAAENRINEQRLEPPVAIPAEFEKAIDSVFFTYSQGNASEAVARLEGVNRKNQTIPSISYLIALMATQSGDLNLALQKVDESIAKGEKLSDSLALKAAIEMEMGGKVGMGDPKVRAESLLRSAMAADISNLRPYIELASLLRFQGRNDEARQLFEAASVRMNPVEGQALVDTSLSLLNLQETPDDKLPVNLDSDKDPRSLVSAAYIAMRKDDIPAVKSLLARARERLSPALYNYLMNDPAIRVFSKNPQMSGLF